MVPAVGMFSVACPSCGCALGAQRESQCCARCGKQYLVRFGHLMPLDPDPATSSLGSPA